MRSTPLDRAGLTRRGTSLPGTQLHCPRLLEVHSELFPCCNIGYNKRDPWQCQSGFRLSTVGTNAMPTVQRYRIQGRAKHRRHMTASQPEEHA